MVNFNSKISILIYRPISFNESLFYYNNSIILDTLSIYCDCQPFIILLSEFLK